jgi:hypothetical protein
MSGGRDRPHRATRLDKLPEPAVASHTWTEKIAGAQNQTARAVRLRFFEPLLHGDADYSFARRCPLRSVLAQHHWPIRREIVDAARK